MTTSSPTRWRLVHSESEIGWGGQEHRILAELKGFKKRGAHVCLLAPAHSQIYVRAEEAGLPVRHLEVGKAMMPAAIAATTLWLRQFRPDVLNTHSSRDSWIAGIAGRLARVPLLIRTRHIEAPPPNRWLSRHPYTTLADHILTTSDKITRQLQDFFQLPLGRVSTVATGVDYDQFEPDGEEADLWPDWVGKPTPLVGMVSVLRSWKGHRTLFEAVKLLKQQGCTIRAAIVGEGPGRPGFETWIRQLELADRVRLLGHREDIPAVLRGLNVLIIPSTDHEGIPQIGLQALATMTPVIGSDVGGIPEIIRHRETGRIFPAKNVEALAAAIREAVAQPEQTRRMAERGREMVMNEYSLEAMLRQLDALYQRYADLRRYAQMKR